jgi:hypothetical protein
MRLNSPEDLNLQLELQFHEFCMNTQYLQNVKIIRSRLQILNFQRDDKKEGGGGK